MIPLYTGPEREEDRIGPAIQISFICSAGERGETMPVTVGDRETAGCPTSPCV